VLPTILASKSLTFGGFIDWFLEKRSKPPFRARKTHLMNLIAAQFPRPTFGNTRLLGIRYREEAVRPMTVHQEFRVLRRILNVADEQKRLSSNPCSAFEFPVSLKNSTQKPHYMTASEQERIELCAPSHLRHIITIISDGTSSLQRADADECR